MKKLKIMNIKFLLLLFFVATNCLYAQTVPVVVVPIYNYFDPSDAVVNPDGSISYIKYYGSNEAKKNSTNNMFTQKRTQVPTKTKSMRQDVFIARIKSDGDLVLNNGNEKYFELVVFANDYETSQITPYSTENENTTRYRYFTKFYIGKLMTNAKYFMKEYIPAGRWGINLTLNDYGYDLIANYSKRGEWLKLDPNFNGVLNSLKISGN